MTTKGQVKPTSWQGESNGTAIKALASQAGENIQTNDPEHIRSYAVF